MTTPWGLQQTKGEEAFFFIDNTPTAGHSNQTFIFASLFFPKITLLLQLWSTFRIEANGEILQHGNMRRSLSCEHNTANQTFLANCRRTWDSHQIHTNRKRRVSRISMSSTRLVAPCAMMEGIYVQIHQGCISNAAGLVCVSFFVLFCFLIFIIDCNRLWIRH